MTRDEARKKIDSFFRREEFSAEEVKKIKRLAMKFSIRLGSYRKLFCKKCLLRLKGKLRVSKTHKKIVCSNCGTLNKVEI